MHSWATTIARTLAQEFPYNAGHMSLHAGDCDVTPTALHPASHGCLDWHSWVHMQYSAVLLADSYNGLAQLLDARLHPTHTQQEADYLRARPSFERPYGWAWAATLAAACRACAHPHAQHWAEAMTPVAEAVFDNLLTWLPRLAYPVRSGVHDNTAFSLGLLWDAAGVLGWSEVQTSIREFALYHFAADSDYPVRWEPSGSDFLFPALCEATLMRRVLVADAAQWLRGFLPGLGEAGDPLLDVPVVRDRTDGTAVHLFGLALSRAWHLRELVPLLTAPAQHRIAEATELQIRTVESEVSDGDFMSTHWLVTFALQAQRAGMRLG